nr:immunoglobulin heavy chain junction region [Macaca mulatta]MOW32421.1 immunoglobulin heavy chain junction region [Macaca mulatta]MOW32483.1 immunoglobulin heavy chain junction region [Macaca mulatta]MOW32850.1 immunoglobulin heavy chain junction region [Macaca mulatta]MOW33633.1 immunoglobulin heavy chain junction region [Macaca mulatta]
CAKCPYYTYSYPYFDYW